MSEPEDDELDGVPHDRHCGCYGCKANRSFISDRDWIAIDSDGEYWIITRKREDNVEIYEGLASRAAEEIARRQGKTPKDPEA